MNWKKRLELAISNTLNKNINGLLYFAEVTSDNSFKIIKIDTEGVETIIYKFLSVDFYLQSRWMECGRNAVKEIVENIYNEELLASK